jgi:carbonic anhydrase
VTDDVLRSLVLSHWLLGTQEALVIGHTDCGAASFTNEELRERIGAAADGVDFLPLADVDAAVRDGVHRIEASPLLPESFAAAGLVYDVAVGRLHPV